MAQHDRPSGSLGSSRRAKVRVIFPGVDGNSHEYDLLADADDIVALVPAGEKLARDPKAPVMQDVRLAIEPESDEELAQRAERRRRLAELRERGRAARERSDSIAAGVAESLERARAHERALRAIQI